MTLVFFPPSHPHHSAMLWVCVVLPYVFRVYGFWLHHTYRNPPILRRELPTGGSSCVNSPSYVLWRGYDVDELKLLRYVSETERLFFWAKTNYKRETMTNTRLHCFGVATERHEESMYFGFLVVYKQKNTQSIVMIKGAPVVCDRSPHPVRSHCPDGFHFGSVEVRVRLIRLTIWRRLAMGRFYHFI